MQKLEGFPGTEEERLIFKNLHQSLASKEGQMD